MTFLGILPVFDYKTSEWAIFKSRLSQFFIVNNISVNKSAILITHLSDESYRLLRKLAYPKEVDKLQYEDLVSLLDSHFKPKQCSFVDKAKFFDAVRSPGEKLGDWAARLRGLASYCDFGVALETNLRDRFVLGLGSGSERDKLFEQNPSTLTFARALELAEQAECSREAKAVQIKDEHIFRADLERNVREGNSRGRGGVRDRPAGTGSHFVARFSCCATCGMKNHQQAECRFKNYKCKKCGQKGHLKKVCSENSRVNCISQPDLDSERIAGGVNDADCEECQTFQMRYANCKPIEISIFVGKQPIKMELDTGSGCSVMSENLYKNMFSHYKLKECKVKMCLYDGRSISPVGYF